MPFDYFFNLKQIIRFLYQKNIHFIEFIAAEWSISCVEIMQSVIPVLTKIKLSVEKEEQILFSKVVYSY